MAVREDALLVSAMTFWEVTMLVQRRRLILVQPVANWRHHVLELGMAEIPVSGDIGILTGEPVRVEVNIPTPGHGYIPEQVGRLQTAYSRRLPDVV